MASPFQKFGGNIGPDIDVRGGIQNSYAPIAEGISTAGKAVGEAIKGYYSEKKEEEANKAKNAADARKEEEARRRFAIEQEREAQKLELERIKIYMGEKAKANELRIKQSEGRYGRLKDRLGELNAEIGGISLNSGDQPLSPDDQARLESLKKTKDALIGEMESASRDIEAAYGDKDAGDSYSLRLQQDEARMGNKINLAASTGGKIFDPVEGVKSGGGVSMTGGLPEPQTGYSNFGSTGNIQMYGGINSMSGFGEEGGAGSPPKFPMGRGSDGYTEDPYSIGPVGSGAPGGSTGLNAGGGLDAQRTGGLVQQSARSGLTGQPLELQPVGSNPVVTDIGTAWRNSNAYEDSEPNPNAKGGRIVYSKGPDGAPVFKLAVNPDANERNKQDLTRLGSIVAFANTMSDQQAIELSGLVRGDKGKNAAQLYKMMRDSGMIPKEMDIVRFKAATALSLYREGGSTALGELSPTAATTIGEVMSKNQDVEIIPPPAPATQMTAPKPVAEYTPSPAEWRPPYDIDRTSRLMRAGISPNHPATKALFEQARFLDQQGLAKARLLAAQQSAAAAVVTAQGSAAKAESEAAQMTGNYEALLPGIGNSKGGADVYYFNRTLGNDSKRDISLEWRDAQRRGGNLHAWNSIVGQYGFNPKLEQQRYENAVEATTSFNRGFDGSMVITRVLEDQMGKSWAPLTYDRITGDRAAVAAQYRLFLLGAFRKATVGLGNPSNFEQELLLNLVPDPTSPFQITTKSLAKARMLTLMTLANHLTDMESSKFVPTSETVKQYSAKLREAGILGEGQEIDLPTLKGFREILRRNAGNTEASIAELRQWATNTKNATLTSIVYEATSDKFHAANSREAQATRLNVQRFLLDSAHLDPSYSGPPPQKEKSGFWGR